jgi:hypothetical protein
MKTVPPGKMLVEGWGEAVVKVDGMGLEAASVVEAAAKGEAGDVDPEKWSGCRSSLGVRFIE